VSTNAISVRGAVRDSRAERFSPDQLRNLRVTKKRLVPSNRAKLDEKSRLFAYEFGVLLCELMPRFQSVFHSDFAKVLIVHAVGVANISRLMSRPDGADFETLSVLVPPELQVPVNALSIAESTGIPRETVRRKIKEMIADGILAEDERGGYRVKPGMLQDESVLELHYQHLLTLTTLVNRCVEAGLIRIEDA
jgi:hypothetical protein